MAPPLPTPKDIPAVSPSVEPAIREPLARVREEVQRLLGTIGVDKLDKAVTWRQAIAQGWSTGVPPGGGISTGGGGGVGGGGGGTTPDLTPPPTPTGLSATGGFSSIVIVWNAPTYTQGHGHGQTNVYGVQRPIPDPNPPPVFGDAAIVTTAYGPTTITSMPSEMNTHWHLWIKWRSVDGVESTAPAGGTNGFQVETGQDITHLLEVLGGAITSTELASALATRINLVDDPDSVAGSVAQRIKVERDRAIAAEGLIVTDVDALELTVNDGTTGVAATASALDVVELIVNHGTSGNVALASRTSSLETTVNDGTNGVAATASALDTVELLVSHATQGNVALATRTSTLETSVNSPTTGNNPTYAALQTEATVRADETGDLFGQYTVKIDLNGFMSGWGLASTVIDGTPISDFMVRADRISFVPTVNYSSVAASPPGAPTTGERWFQTDTKLFKRWDGSAWVTFSAVPFSVLTSPATESGVSIPAGVYMDAAYIRNVNALVGRFGSLWVDNGMIADLSAAKLTIGDGTVGGDLKSTTYTAGSGSTPGAGWLVQPGGAAFFQNATVYGTIYASAGLFAGQVKVGSTPARSGTTMTGSGAVINADGTFAIGNATTNATFDGTTLTLNGAVVAQANLATAAVSLTKIDTATIPLLSSLAASLGSVEIAAGGYLRSAKTSFTDTTAGFWQGWIGTGPGEPGIAIGNATAYMRFRPSTGLELKLDSFTAACSPSTVDEFPTTTGFSFDNVTTSPTGGAGPYSYAWTLEYITTNPVNSGATVTLVGVSGTYGQTASFDGTIPDNSGITAYARCVVTDSNGRSAAASVTLNATRGTIP